MGLPASIPLIASGIQAVSDWFAGSSANNANKELAELSFQKNKEMFDYTNAYNSPAAQMKRFAEAGLNPNLIYGQQGTSITPPKYEPPKIEKNAPRVENLAENLMLGLAMKRQKAEIENVQANTDLTKQKQQTEKLVQGIKDVTGQTGIFQLDQAKQLSGYNVQIQQANAEKAQQEVAKVKQEITNMSRDEALKKLQIHYQENVIDQQQIDKDIKEAQLLFQNQQNAMRNMGINDGDDPRLRIFVRALNELGINPYELLKRGINTIKDYYNK